MAHFVSPYADRINDILHDFSGVRFFKQEILEVPGLLTGLIITYDGVRDDAREIRDALSWQEFLDRMGAIKRDWKNFDRSLVEELAKIPEKTISGWEGRTIYFIRGGKNPERWSLDAAAKDAGLLLAASHKLWGPLVELEVLQLRQSVPVGREHFKDYEHKVRVIFRFLFRSELGDGHVQSRTEPENDGVEIRDLIFANKASSGFWKDLKDKYAASEIVVDAKNTDEVTREDLRQLYCYLKPALGFWGFIVCRSPPSAAIQAFNRTLFKNFAQQRGVLILSDDDLQRMVKIANRGHSASEYLQERKSEFVRSI
jgi:hypothetical protein